MLEQHLLYLKNVRTKVVSTKKMLEQKVLEQKLRCPEAHGGISALHIPTPNLESKTRTVN
jgi:hypothetical protein